MLAPRMLVNWLLERRGSVATAVAVCALVAWAFAGRFAFLTETPYAVGIDGYFYPVQLRALLDSGTLYYASSPLALWLMAPLAAVWGPILGAKIGASLATASIAAPVYLLGRRIAGGRAYGLLAAALVATSAESFYASVEFVKTGFGMTLAACYLCALAWCLDAPSRRRIAFAALALLATGLTHTLALALALIATPAPLAVLAWSRSARTCRSERAARIGAVGIGASAVVAVIIVASNTALFHGVFSSTPDFSIPALDIGEPAPLLFAHEPLIAGVLGVAAMVLLIWPRAGATSSPAAADTESQLNRAIVVGPALFAIGAALPWLDASDPQGLVFRLRLILFVPLALCAAFVAGTTLRRIGPPMRTGLVIGFAAGWVISRPAISNEGTVVPEPHMVAAVRAVSVPDDAVIVCPQRSLMFMVTWYTNTPARLRPEPVPPSRRWRLLPGRLIHPDLAVALDRLRDDQPTGVPQPRGLHPRHRNGLVLMSEVTWTWLMQRVPADVRALYLRWPTI